MSNDLTKAKRLVNIHVTWVFIMGVIGLMALPFWDDREGIAWWIGIISSLLIVGSIVYWWLGRPGLWLLLAVVLFAGISVIVFSYQKQGKLFTIDNFAAAIGVIFLSEVLLYGILSVSGEKCKRRE